VRVIGLVNMSLHAFQKQPFTLIRVLYEYDFHSYKVFMPEMAMGTVFVTQPDQTIDEQENHAIAKMTARCAQYRSALKMFDSLE